MARGTDIPLAAALTMDPLIRQIKDTAYRIDRLARYAGDPNSRHVKKEKGVMHMSFGPSITFMVMCVPREARVWIRTSATGNFDGPVVDEPDRTHESGLRWLLAFEYDIRKQAEAKAREEVINELVQRKMRRIVRAKTRGFKADAKKQKRSGQD